MNKIKNSMILIVFISLYCNKMCIAQENQAVNKNTLVTSNQSTILMQQPALPGVTSTTSPLTSQAISSSYDLSGQNNISAHSPSGNSTSSNIVTPTSGDNVNTPSLPTLNNATQNNAVLPVSSAITIPNNMPYYAHQADINSLGFDNTSTIMHYETQINAPANPSVSPIITVESIIKSDEDTASTAEEHIGIDTVDLQEPQGNWLFKRIWWERAQERYEKIRAIVDQIWELRMEFFLSRSEIDRTKLDPFYVAVGFSQSELQQSLNSLIENTQKKSQIDGIMDAEENNLLTTAQDQIKILEEIKTNVDNIITLDQGLNNALERLMEQINRVRIYEQESWNEFKEIAQVLNDTKARELYYKMDVSWRNIKDIYKYLQQDFIGHFNDLVKKLTYQLDVTKKSVEELKEKGIDLKNKSKNIENAYVKKPAFISVGDTHEDDQEQQEQVNNGWVAKSLQALTDGTNVFWSFITYPFTFLYNKVFGSKTIEPSEQ